MEQSSLYGTFIDLWKAYDTMDHEHLVGILQDTWVGLKSLRPVIMFWGNAELVCKAGGYFSQIFKAKHGITQGGPLLPIISNLKVDTVVRA